MTIIDLKEQREARRRAELDRFYAEMDRRLEEITLTFERLKPMFDELIAQEDLRKRSPRCEAPKCSNDMTTLHPAQGHTSDDAPALLRLCPFHLNAMRSGRLRVNTVETDMLLWQLCNGPDAPPHWQIKWPRRKPKIRGHNTQIRAPTRPDPR